MYNKGSGHIIVSECKQYSSWTDIRLILKSQRLVLTCWLHCQMINSNYGLFTPIALISLHAMLQYRLYMWKIGWILLFLPKSFLHQSLLYTSE